MDLRLVDGLLAVLVGVVGILGLIVSQLAGAATTRLPVAVVLVVAQSAPLWWRRRRPLAVLAVTLAALVAAQAAGDINAASFWGPHMAAYAAAAYTDRRGALVALGLLVTGALLDGAVVRWLVADLGYGAVLLGPTGAAALAAWGIGRYVLVRRAYLDAVLAYTHRLEHEREEELGRALGEERRRIARDLHDQVAHHLGVVSLQTAAARRWLDRDRDRTAEALGAAEAASRAALETMPVILQALRADDIDPSRDPQPTLADLDTLVDQVRGAGVGVDVETGGLPRRLPAAVELTAYRVVQEALTNVLRHAGRANATVRLTYGDEVLDIDVDDDGDGAASTNGRGAGLGLVGMRERVELLQGELETGPRAGGGFRVHARLPASGSQGA